MSIWPIVPAASASSIPTGDTVSVTRDLRDEDIPPELQSKLRSFTRRHSAPALVVAIIVAMLLPQAVWAGKADVAFVEVRQEDAETWTFAVTVHHDDRDPDHWADWWRVRTVDGRELGRRVLLHSHVDEQPFTRDERVRVPREVRTVVVEAHDKRHGLGGATVTVDLSKASGPNFRRRAR
jgi:hypothetical protein